MTQQEHPTTEQLSAFLDKQLTSQERAFFDAHLQSCPRCQGVLGELHRTVALLHAMPQPQLPRSFTLPAAISHTQVARPARRGQRYTLQGSVRAISALAAAIAVIIILSGLGPLTGVHFMSNGTISSSSAPVAGSSNGTGHSPATRPNATVSSQTRDGTPDVAGTPILGSHQTGTPATATPTSAATAKSAGTLKGGPTNSPTLPSFLDVSQAAGRLTLGALLLLLSIAGIVATRRRRDVVS